MGAMGLEASEEVLREVFVGQGEFRVSADPGVVLTTLLGSCVSVCLYDLQARVGGMNHFLLPSIPGDAPPSERYGLYAIEMLINGLLKAGAVKSRLEAKLFGGACMGGSLSHIGRQNVSFAKDVLVRESIPCRAESLGGQQGRRLRFTPTTGNVRQFLVEDAPPERKPAMLPPGDITFFED